MDPPAGEQLFSSDKRKLVGNPQEDQEEEEEMGGQAGDGASNLCDRAESDQIETSRGANLSSLIESNSNSDSNSERGWYPGVQSKQHAGGTATTLLRAVASEADGQETREGQNAAPAAPDLSAPAPTQPAWAQGTSTPEEYAYLSPDEGEEMEDKGEETKPSTTNFDSDHAEETRCRYDGSNSGAFVAAAGEPSEEPIYSLSGVTSQIPDNRDKYENIPKIG